MQSYNELIESKKNSQLFLFGIYRSGTTILARSLAGEKIAFASDPICLSSIGIERNYKKN